MKIVFAAEDFKSTIQGSINVTLVVGEYNIPANANVIIEIKNGYANVYLKDLKIDEYFLNVNDNDLKEILEFYLKTICLDTEAAIIHRRKNIRSMKIKIPDEYKDRFVNDNHSAFKKYILKKG